VVRLEPQVLGRKRPQLLVLHRTLVLHTTLMPVLHMTLLERHRTAVLHNWSLVLLHTSSPAQLWL